MLRIKLLKAALSMLNVLSLHMLFLGLLFLCVLPAATQPVEAADKVYRCGDTFSQVPCAPDAKELNVRADGSKAPTSGICGERLRGELGVTDADSLRITASSDGKLAPFEYTGKKILARHYQLSVASRQPSGAYQPAGRYACITSEDGFRVLSLQQMD